MIVMKIVIIILGTKIIFRKSSPHYTLSSRKNKAKCYFRHSLQRSVPMGYNNIYIYIYIYIYIQYIYILYIHI